MKRKAIGSFVGMAIVLGAVGLVLLTASVQAQDGPYKLGASMKLGGDGGWDYLNVDEGAHRLYIARGTGYMVVDLDTGKQVGEVTDINGAHGVAVVPGMNLGFGTSGRDNMAVAFDTKTLKVLGKVKTGEGPDAIIYDPASGHVMSMDHRGGTVTVIDPRTRTAVATIQIGGALEYAVADGKGHVYVNVEDKSELVDIDSKTNKILARWKLGTCKEPSGLAADWSKGHLFAGCGNKVMAVVEAKSGKLLANLPIGDGVDGTAFDEAGKVAVSANGQDGTMTFVGERKGKYEVIQTLVTKKGARTITYDPGTKQLLTVSADFGPAPAKTTENPRPRPSILPDTFVVITAGKK